MTNTNTSKKENDMLDDFTTQIQSDEDIMVSITDEEWVEIMELEQD